MSDHRELPPESTETLQATSKTAVPSIHADYIVFFVVMGVIFSGIGCWAGISSGWPLALAVLVGVIGGFVASYVTMILAARGMDI